MSWRTPPNRRELTLILFSLTVFILFYNLDASFRLLGVDPASSQTALLSKFGFKTGIIGTDGRKPPGWRDKLEGQIFGEWGWEEGQVAGNGAEREKVKGGKEDKYGAIWLGQAKTGAGENQAIFGEGVAGEAFMYWGDNVPTTKVVKHVPGYTILDSVIMVNGSLWIVTDDPLSIPALGLIASSSIDSKNDPRPEDWRVVSKEEARTLGMQGGLIRGVSWLATDIEPSNHTLISLWRTYSSLDTSIDSQGRTTLTPPRRLFFPYIPYFTQKRPDPDDPEFPRIRSKTGVDESTAKAAFPALSLLHREDWEDFANMQIPFVLERVVVADRGAAARARSVGDEQPVFSPPFAMESSLHWWEPVRRMMAGFCQLADERGKKSSSQLKPQAETKPVVTYLSTQEKPTGPRMGDAEHQTLVKALNEFGYHYGYEVNVVPGDATWTDRMRVLTRSTIVLGVHGTNLADSYFMRPSTHTTLMEFFPDGYFSRDRELPARSLGTRYIAWWNERKFIGDSLPPTIPPAERQVQVVPINTKAVIQAIREEIERPVAS